MKNKFVPAMFLAVMLSAMPGLAQNFYYKANNADALNLPAGWTNNATPTSGDWAGWDTNVVAAANCTNNLGASTNWGGIQIHSPPVTVCITNVGQTLTLGTPSGSGLGIDMSQATVDLSLNIPVITVATQTWNIASGRNLGLNPGTGTPFEIEADMAINGGGTLNAYAIKDFRVGGGCNLFLTNGTTLDFSQAPSGAPSASLSVGYAGLDTAVTGTVVQTAGIVKLCKNSTGTGCLLLGANGGTAPTTGIYDLNGGSIVDTNSTKADYFSIGDGASDTGILNVNGGSVYVAQVQVGNNGYGYVNVISGTVTTGTIHETPSLTEGGAFLLNKGGSSLGGFLNVSGGTVNIIGNSLTVGNRGAASAQDLGGVLTLSGTGVIDVGGSVDIPNTATSSGAQAPGVATINGGLLNVSNNIVLGGANFGLANLSGTLNLNGGTVIANGVTTSTSSPQCWGLIYFNGGTFQARENNGNFIQNTANGVVCVTNFVMAGGAIIDDGGFAITISSPLLNGTGGPDGGLTKLDTGTLTLTADNMYYGPTIVGGGTLALGTTNLAGGVILPGAATIDVTNGTLSVSLAAPGTSLVCSNLTFGGSGGVTALNFMLSTNSNPTVPLINVTNNLSVAGNVTVNINEDNLTAGTIPLIQYTGGNYSGGGTFSLGVVGWSGFVTNNTSAQQVQLVLVSPLNLVWRALVNTNWDTLTANWFNLDGGLSATYQDGSTILFDDSTSNALVKVNNTFSPGPMTLNNNSSNYVFSGSGSIAGVTTISKLGSGAVTMSLSNSYTGGTVISNGFYTLGVNNAIPAASDTIVQSTLDLAGFSTGVHSLNGNGVVNSSGAGSAVLSIGGNGGTFTGIITNTGSSLALTKGGGNLYLLAPRNFYTGGTTNSGGLLELADAQTISTGPLMLAGGALAFATPAPQTITNFTTMSGGVTFGTVTNVGGLLTFSGTVNFAGTGHGLTCYQDVLLANGMTNGSLSSMNGSNTLTLLNTTDIWTSGSFSLGSGYMVLTNSIVTEEFNNFRVQCGLAGYISDLQIAKGSSLILSNNAGGSDFRFGDSASGGAGATNELDLFGTLDLIPQNYTGGNCVQMGSTTDPSEYNILNLNQGGLLIVREVRDLSISATAVFNFDGGTLEASTNDFASTFMQDLTTANVLGGGAIINDGGFNGITIAQPLVNDGVDQDGGLTKLGSGVLYLNGACTYTNLTQVAAGGLGGSGTLMSAVTVASGAGMYAGASPTNIGTFTIDNSVTLAAGSSAVMKIDKLSGVTSSDNIAGVTKLSYGGTLVIVTNFDMNSALAIGDTFTLFTAASYSGSFAHYSLPALPAGMGWNTSQLDVNGSISIVSVPITPPVIKTVSLNGTSLVLSGSNGTAFSNYYVLASTNLVLPLADWTVIATNSFDSSGNFISTNQINPATPAMFFDISVP